MTKKTTALPERLRDTGIGAFLFAVLGPAIGAAIITPLLILADLTRSDVSAIDELSVLPGFFLLVLAIAYYAQVVPAAITGGIAGWQRSSLSSRARHWSIGVCGAVLTVANAYVRDPSHGGIGFDIVLAAIGLVASVVCTRVLKRT